MRNPIAEWTAFTYKFIANILVNKLVCLSRLEELRKACFGDKYLRNLGFLKSASIETHVQIWKFFEREWLDPHPHRPWVDANSHF